MVPLLDTLRRLSRTDLVDLYTVLTDRSDIDEGEDTSQLSRRLVTELQQLCGLTDGDDARLERHIVRRIANGLRIDYDPTMDATEITRRVHTFISNTIVEDLRPFIQVAVCMGWADGKLLPEEIAVVDAALSRLRLLVKRRSELLQLCSAPIRPTELIETLSKIQADDQKAWSLLALGWAVALADLRTHPQEIVVFHEIADLLGVTTERADRLRALVKRRFDDTLTGSDVDADGGPVHPRALTKATLGAIMAAELDGYLQAKIGLKTLSLLMSSPVPVSGYRDSIQVLNAVLGDSGWVGAPTVMAGTLFLRRLGHDQTAQRLLVVMLLCLERGR